MSIKMGIRGRKEQYKEERHFGWEVIKWAHTEDRTVLRCVHIGRRERGHKEIKNHRECVNGMKPGQNG